jgi:hypothetical protein
MPSGGRNNAQQWRKQSLNHLGLPVPFYPEKDALWRNHDQRKKDRKKGARPKSKWNAWVTPCFQNGPGETDRGFGERQFGPSIGTEDGRNISLTDG